LIDVLLDDTVFEGFLEQYSLTFSEEQSHAAFSLRNRLAVYNNSNPSWLNPAEVLADPEWDAIRRDADDFVSAFKGKWPTNST
jgi:hypothetical protein